MRVLIISPYFPPSNTADMQRVRLLLPYLKEVGIEAEVLAVDPTTAGSPVDEWLVGGLPLDVPVHRVKSLGGRWSKIPGLGVLSLRALRAIRRRGNELLSSGDESGKLKADKEPVGNSRSAYDLIYFSTTQFALHMLGPYWKRKFGVPFVMDYQDPWVTDYYKNHPEIVPPGGRVKYGLVSWISRRQEPRVLKECAGITSVSAAYPKQLARRYGGEEENRKQSRAERDGQDRTGRARWGSPEGGIKAESGNRETTDGNLSASGSQLSTLNFPLWATSLPSTVLPFPGDDRDLQRVKDSDIKQSVFDPSDGKRHWVYVGAGGPMMQPAVRAMFAAISSLPERLNGLRIHFVGTSYAAEGRAQKTIEPLASEFGLADIVEEHPGRIPYSEALRCLADADALLVPGTDDPGYTASKIYPYLLSSKPMLAVFHESSPVVELVREMGGATLVTFRTGESTMETCDSILASQWLQQRGEQTVRLNPLKLASYSARSQAKHLADFFSRCFATTSCA